MELKQIIYASSLAPGVDESCIEGILEAAVANNSRQGFTGLLLYVNRSFLQVLEGEAEALDALFEKIRQDPRHTRPWTLSSAPIAQREFADWSMGLARPSVADLDTIGPRNDFFRKGHCLTELDEGMARKVLQEFRSGMWRIQVH